MAGRIKVEGVRQKDPDARLCALALIELARQLRTAEAGGSKPHMSGVTRIKKEVEL